MNRNRYKEDRYGQQHYDNYDYEEDYGNSGYHQHQHQPYEDDGYDQGVHDFYDTVPATNVARIQVVEQQRGYMASSGVGVGSGVGYAKGHQQQQQQRYIDGFGGVSSGGGGGGSKKKETPNAVRSIINNLKQSDLKQQQQQQQHQQEESPRNRVSTNPFMRANQLQQQQQQQQQSRFDQLPKKQVSKNVAEVVEKMNNGDWPIRIEDEVNVISEEKAKQWETLHRKKEEKRQTILESPKGSEKSSHHEEETTTVSTDSALCSETAETLTTSTRGPSPYKLPFGGPTSDLAEEADKLLGYFKSHREVLNYLGIGLPDRLWQHINKMPTQDIKLQFNSSIPKIITPTPTPIINNNKKQQPVTTIISPVPATTPTPVPVPVSVPPPPPPPITPEFQKQQDMSKGGRFVKKSAAALIAKKQGIVTEDPNSATEIIDPRIAEEIKNLRDREDELKRSRENLNSLSGSGMRGAASYDHFDSDTELTTTTNKTPIERSHSSHNVYIENSNAEFSHRQQHPQNQSYGAHNYGSMPRTHHQRREERFEAAQVGQQQQQQYARRDSEHSSSNDRGYRATRNPDFFRTPPPSETQNTNRPKSAATFETKSPYHTGLQLPPANVSISTYQRPNTTNSSASKGVYGKFEQRKMGL